MALGVAASAKYATGTGTAATPALSNPSQLHPVLSWTDFGAIDLVAMLLFALVVTETLGADRAQGPDDRDMQAPTVIGGALLLFGLVTGLLLLLVCAGPCDIAGLGLIALGFFVVGSIVGMLFALTKYAEPTPGTDGAMPGGDGAFAPRPNTNLQKVSDWLTTSITAITLSQIVVIPGYIQHFATFLQSNLDVGRYAAPIAAGMALYFPALGFVFGYFAQRLVFNRALVIADRGLTKSQRASVDSPFTNRQRLLEIPLEPTPEQIATAKSVVAIPLESLTSASDKASWARAQAILKSSDQAIIGFRAAIALDPNNLNILEDYANILYQADKDPNEVISILDQAQKLALNNPKALARILGNKALAYLYVPDGYKMALSILDDMLSSPDLPKRGLDYYYRACAYGQKWQATQESGTRADLATKIKDDTRTSLNLDPQLKSWFRTVSDPNDTSPDKDPEDNDLEAFAAQDAEYRQLIGMTDGAYGNKS